MGRSSAAADSGRFVEVQAALLPCRIPVRSWVLEAGKGKKLFDVSEANLTTHRLDDVLLGRRDVWPGHVRAAVTHVELMLLACR